jgi:uncharacterized protein (TIGR02145 family)
MEEMQNPPLVSLNSISDKTTTSAKLYGEITSDGLSEITDKGFILSDSINFSKENTIFFNAGSGKGTFNQLLSHLKVNKRYYCKAYATNKIGTSYSSVETFSTLDYKNVFLRSENPNNITQTSVELNGAVLDEGGGKVEESGFVLGISPNPSVLNMKFAVSNGKNSFKVVIDNLNYNTKYFFRPYAKNEKGISYGIESSFTTLDIILPKIETTSIINITENSATIIGTVFDDGGAEVSERGVCYNTMGNPSISDIKLVSGRGKGEFLTEVAKLFPSTKYYLKSYAINSKGVNYGLEMYFNTKSVNTKIVEVTSKTGKIWMDRNLGASQVAISLNDEKAFGFLYQWGRENDSHQLRNSQTTSTRASIDSPKNNLFIICPTYPWDWRVPTNNNLWQGVNGINNVCPAGYRLPTDKEWEAEINSWTPKNIEGAFQSPLKLTLAGFRDVRGGDLIMYYPVGFYWSSTVWNNEDAGVLNMLNSNYNASITSNKKGQGNSVRCIKN